MTVEHLLLIEPNDVRALRIVCKKCRSALALQLNETIRVPSECPGCREAWQLHETAAASTAATNLGDAIKSWLASQTHHPPRFTLYFEVTDPTA